VLLTVNRKAFTVSRESIAEMKLRSAESDFNIFVTTLCSTVDRQLKPAKGKGHLIHQGWGTLRLTEVFG